MRCCWLLLVAPGCAWDLLASDPTRDPAASLVPCSSVLRCVHSEADPSSAAHVAPLPAASTEGETLNRLRSILANEPRAHILVDEPPYLHVRFVTPICRFRDDLELRYDAEAGLVQVRSESRIGGSDLGANRARVERLRAALEDTKP